MTVRFLADENLPGPAVRMLRERGLDVAWVRDFSPGLADEAVLALSQAEGRVLITFDKDFGELARRRGLPAACGVVLFRIQTRNPLETAEQVWKVLVSRSDWSGHFSVVSNTGIRSLRE
jgi:predicted nuclease of predicted toxin-antitoxin system